jgi:hypothetical protein
MDLNEDLRKYVENEVKLDEHYQLLTHLMPAEAYKEFGFYLDPSQTKIINGAKYYRKITPDGEPNGWMTGYECQHTVPNHIVSIHVGPVDSNSDEKKK